jgi:hypothetical protein
MNIITINVYENSSNIYKYLVDKTSLVSKFKEKLCFSYKKKIYFVNKKNYKSIDENLSFDENDLHDNDDILIILRLSGSYELVIRLIDVNNIKYLNITVDGSDTIEEVKTKILKICTDNNYNFENKILSLSYNDALLNNDEMLRNYKIIENSILNCYVNL